jgi:hypothetical protein
MTLPAIHGHQVGDQFSGHRQRGSIGIALLLFPVIQQRQRWAVRGAILAASISVVGRCLLRCFDSGVRCAVFAERRSSPHRPQ